jgi:hypothetical protein
MLRQQRELTTTGGLSRRNLLTACLVFSGLAVMVVDADDASKKSAPLATRASLIPSLPAVEILETARVAGAAVVEAPAETHQPTPLEFAISLLEEAQRRIHAVESYSAHFIQQEQIGGVLGEENRIRLKVRHAPFSVYMGWIEPNEGREVIYVDGRDDNRLLAHEGGWKRLLVPMVRLDPNGTQAMKTSRHPITEVGLAYLTDRLLEDRVRELSIETVQVTLNEASDRDGRACWRLEHHHAVPDGTEYGKVIFYLDQQLGIPVWCQTFDWPSGGTVEGDLLESYYYGELQLEAGLSDLDFDCQNSEYGFQRL